jgi:hypothetical protein
VYETGEWHKGFIEATIIALKKAIKFSYHRKTSLVAHTAKIVKRVLRRKIEKKLEGVLADRFGLIREK